MDFIAKYIFIDNRSEDITALTVVYLSPGRLQALVTSASVRSPVAPEAQTEGQGGQSQQGADHARHLAGGQGGALGPRHD